MTFVLGLGRKHVDRSSRQFSNMQYEFPTLESGTMLYIELAVVDFGGNIAKVSGTVEVP